LDLKNASTFPNRADNATHNFDLSAKFDIIFYIKMLASGVLLHQLNV